MCGDGVRRPVAARSGGRRVDFAGSPRIWIAINSRDPKCFFLKKLVFRKAPNLYRDQ
jgi:hypothetical protein